MNEVMCCLSMIPSNHSDRPSRVYHKPSEIFVQLHGQFGGGRLMVMAGNVSRKRAILVMVIYWQIQQQNLNHSSCQIHAL